jgi:predicted nucleic acid-binding protein
MQTALIDTNIWIYIIDGKSEVKKLVRQIKMEY